MLREFDRHMMTKVCDVITVNKMWGVNMGFPINRSELRKLDIKWEREKLNN